MAEEALRQREAAIHALYTITATRQRSLAAKTADLLAMGCAHFGLDTGVLARIAHGRYEISAVHGPADAPQAGTVRDLAATFAGGNRAVRYPSSAGTCRCLHLAEPSGLSSRAARSLSRYGHNR